MSDEKDLAMAVIGGVMASTGGAYGLMFFMIGSTIAFNLFFIMAIGAFIIAIIGVYLLIVGAMNLMSDKKSYKNYRFYQPPPALAYRPDQYRDETKRRKKKKKS